jgi:hypothetical protein
MLLFGLVSQVYPGIHPSKSDKARKIFLRWKINIMVLSIITTEKDLLDIE